MRRKPRRIFSSPLSAWPLTLTFHKIEAQRSGFDFERRSGLADVEFSPQGGNGTQLGRFDEARWSSG